jgi:hypothetical protein
MSSERYIKAIIYLAVLAWTIVLLINHEAIHSAWLRPLSTVITVVMYTVLAFDLWLWKLPILHGWFVKRPVIDGIWKVEIRSNWENPATGTAISPVEGFMAVRQTFSTLSMRLITAESTSELVGTEIVCSADGLYCISGVYRNVIDTPPQKVTGHYWTDRKSAGEIELTDRRSKKFQDFQSARNYYLKPVR